ncbi:thiamine phosphate synthase [Candidatus Peregrinibacteria bacterium]|nr:thiamine phosphate synthase [Candidatus Peregrinibacteria bacterium]
MIDQFGLYCITHRGIPVDADIVDSSITFHDDMIAQVVAMIRGGAKIIQYRNKDFFKKKSKSDFVNIKKLRKITRDAGVVFIVNDRLDVALEVGADGVHLGQDDMSMNEARNVLVKHFLNNMPQSVLAKTNEKNVVRKREFIVGRSTHSLEQALRAEKDGVSYISIGPVFSTLTKPDYKPVGLDVVRAVVRSVNIPVVAIGGITEANLYDVLDTGVKNVAMVREITEAKNIETKVKNVNGAMSNYLT